MRYIYTIEYIFHSGRTGTWEIRANNKKEAIETFIAAWIYYGDDINSLARYSITDRCIYRHPEWPERYKLIGQSFTH